jgi:hypothetical protein
MLNLFQHFVFNPEIVDPDPEFVETLNLFQGKVQDDKNGIFNRSSIWL